MNENKLVTDRFSSPESEARYKNVWAEEPCCGIQHQNGQQCGGCSFFAPFNADWGLCCHPKSRHFSETVFEHFTCPSYVHEGWGPHSFTEDSEFHCRCDRD
jgi:hypothetical protein